jgi:hypothetical protein
MWFGRPSLYYGFMANVLEHQCEDVIVPLTLDSDNAHLLLQHLKIEADFVYIDGSHELNQADRDMNNYLWKVLRRGGCMMVDDLTGHFPGVLEAWSLIYEIHGIELDTLREKGRLWRP